MVVEYTVKQRSQNSVFTTVRIFYPGFVGQLLPCQQHNLCPVCSFMALLHTMGWLNLTES